jgi:hypothetical protein
VRREGGLSSGKRDGEVAQRAMPLLVTQAQPCSTLSRQGLAKGGISSRQRYVAAPLFRGDWKNYQQAGVGMDRLRSQLAHKRSLTFVRTRDAGHCVVGDH